MPEVRIGSEIKTYPQGTAYAEIAEEYQKNYENDILLVSVNGRLRELHKTLQKDCQMEFITAADTAGYLAYQRSAVFLMMKAFRMWWERSSKESDGLLFRGKWSVCRSGRRGDTQPEAFKSGKGGNGAPGKAGSSALKAQ